VFGKRFAGSQFFIHVVDAISLVDTGDDTKPEVDVVIYTITILGP